VPAAVGLEVVKSVLGGDIANCAGENSAGQLVVHIKMIRVTAREVFQQESGDKVLLHRLNPFSQTDN
jgi:hypothetical protein